MRKTIWVYIVVKKKLLNSASLSLGVAQKKRSTFTRSCGAPSQLVDAFVPHVPHV